MDFAISTASSASSLTLVAVCSASFARLSIRSGTCLMALSRSCLGASLNNHESSSSSLPPSGRSSTLTVQRLSPHRPLILAYPSRSTKYSGTPVSDVDEELTSTQAVTPGFSLFTASSRVMIASPNTLEAVFRVCDAKDSFWKDVLSFAERDSAVEDSDIDFLLSRQIFWARSSKRTPSSCCGCYRPAFTGASGDVLGFHRLL